MPLAMLVVSLATITFPAVSFTWVTVILYVSPDLSVVPAMVVVNVAAS